MKWGKLKQRIEAIEGVDDRTEILIIDVDAQSSNIDPAELFVSPERDCVIILTKHKQEPWDWQDWPKHSPRKRFSYSLDPPRESRSRSAEKAVRRSRRKPR
jgi:hypothetical protein